jgi:hypothetical protein
MLVDGPNVNDFTTNYADLKTWLDDEKYMNVIHLNVARTKTRFDLMFFYMKTSHTVDVCMYKKNESNAIVLAAHPVLFIPSEAQCIKSTQTMNAFETGLGAALVKGRLTSDCTPEAACDNIASYGEQKRGGTCGPKGADSGSSAWTTLHDCIHIAKTKGLTPRTADFRYVQKLDNECYY